MGCRPDGAYIFPPCDVEKRTLLSRAAPSSTGQASTTLRQRRPNFNTCYTRSKAGGGGGRLHVVYVCVVATLTPSIFVVAGNQTKFVVYLRKSLKYQD